MCKFLIGRRQRYGGFINILVGGVCDGVNNAYPALRMSYNADIIKINLLVKNTYCILDFLIIIPAFQITQAHFSPKSVPGVAFFCPDYNKAPRSHVFCNRGIF